MPAPCPGARRSRCWSSSRPTATVSPCTSRAFAPSSTRTIRAVCSSYGRLGGARLARERRSEARRRGYPFPILRDRGAKLAEALGAKYATYSVVLDPQARVRYRGGIDTDKSHVHDDATAYLSDALDDLLADREPRVAEGKTLGCSLQKW